MIADWTLKTLRWRRSLWVALASVAMLFAGTTTSPMATGNAADSEASQRLVVRHVGAAFALKNVETLAISDPKLPATIQSFAAYQRCRIQNMHYCLISEQRVYCGAKRGEFQRFLSDHRYFEKLDMNAGQLLRLYTILEVPPAEMNVGDVLEDVEDIRDIYTWITPPVLQQGPDQLVLTFFWKATEDHTPVKRTIAVSRDYHVEMADEPLAQEN